MVPQLPSSWLPLLATALLLSCERPPPSWQLAPPDPTWGAVFWSGGQAYRLGGGGDQAVGPRAVAQTQPGSAPAGACGASIAGAPERAVLIAPAGAQPQTPVKPPALPAPLVESAAWRLDEALPPRDAYSPNTGATDPARQRGVEVGSVVKMRRYGAPPVLLAAGTRDCTGVVSIIDADLRQNLQSLTIPESCGRARLLPPADLDGDGARETAFFTEDRVVLLRLVETPASITLTTLSDWRCPLPQGP